MTAWNACLMTMYLDDLQEHRGLPPPGVATHTVSHLMYGNPLPFGHSTIPTSSAVQLTRGKEKNGKGQMEGCHTESTSDFHSVYIELGAYGGV